MASRIRSAMADDGGGARAEAVFGLVKQIEHDPEVPKKKAAKALGHYGRFHPESLSLVQYTVTRC